MLTLIHDSHLSQRQTARHPPKTRTGRYRLEYIVMQRSGQLSHFILVRSPHPGLTVAWRCSAPLAFLRMQQRLPASSPRRACASRARWRSRSRCAIPPRNSADFWQYTALPGVAVGEAKMLGVHNASRGGFRSCLPSRSRPAFSVSVRSVRRWIWWTVGLLFASCGRSRTGSRYTPRAPA